VGTHKDSTLAVTLIRPASNLRGGANRIAQEMAKKLERGRIELGKRVTKIAPIKDGDAPVRRLAVHVEGELAPRTQYGHVISTLPLGCLRMVDLEECKLAYALKEALRCVQYGVSVKIGIQFKTRWWEQDGPNMGHEGGVSSTDR
jgi:monoamine oxidase